MRYVVVDTGNWLSGRLVLISPLVFTNFDLDGVRRSVSLTRKQIENSPDFESDKPVSRQYEDAYSRYYGLSNYEQGGGMWGIGAFPVVVPFPEEEQGRSNNGSSVSEEHGDPHLRSMQALKGYHIQTDDGPIGHVIDFIIEHDNWAVAHLVIETGHWFAGKEIVIAPKNIMRISYEESKIYVDVTKESILQAPEYHVFPWAFQDTAGVAAKSNRTCASSLFVWGLWSKHQIPGETDLSG